MYQRFKLDRLKHVRSLALLVIGASTLLMPQQSEAVPAFSRQTGMACNSCHFQNFPALNSFGRSFRAQGYTMRGAQKLIEADGLSLPSTLNASVITKLRYQLHDSDAGGRGEIQWPDEAALLIGGRASENVGFLMELGLGPQEAGGTGAVGEDLNGDGVIGAGETVYAETDVHTESTGSFLSTKFHFNVTDNFAVVVFGTDGLGAGYGFELMNTGVQRSQRPIENRKGFSAPQMLGTASGEATGITLAYHTNDMFINYSHWAPSWGNGNANLAGGLAHYLRVAYMPTIGGWDTGIGFSTMSGTIKVGANEPADMEIAVDSMTIDAQAQGTAGGMPVGLYFSYGTAPKSTDPTVYNFYNTTAKDRSAMGLLAKVGVAANTSAYVAYGSLDNGTTSVATTTIGVQYNLAQNVKLEAYNVTTDAPASDDYTMLMFFAGF